MSEPEHIFVYGSLRAGYDHPMARHLESQARLIGEARVPGLLYDMGWYPAAFFDATASGTIVGDVFALKPDKGLIVALDYYEDGGPDFMRAPLSVALSGGGQLIAWAYGVSAPLDAPVIPGGDFLAHWKAKSQRPTQP